MSKLVQIFAEKAGFKRKLQERKPGVVAYVSNDGWRIECGGTRQAWRELTQLVHGAQPEGVKELKGNTAYPGKVRGEVGIISHKKDLDKFVPGSVLVTSMTRPEFLPIMKQAGVESSEVNLPHAGAESFAEYERFLDGNRKRMLYIQVGGMKREKAEHYLKSGEPVGMECVHHSDIFRVQDSAMGYGVSLDALAIQYARSWKREKSKKVDK